MGVEAEIITLVPRPTTRQYKWDDLTVERLDKLADIFPYKDEVDILRDAIGNFLSQMERDERPSLIVPSERRRAAKSHKRRPDAA
jgi:hypothetical protein